MNKGYTYIDGKVIISDEDGNHITNDYYDNLDQVLVQENIIDDIEFKMKRLGIESDRYKRVEFDPILLKSIGVGLLVGPPLAIWMCTGTNPYTVHTDISNNIFGSANLVLVTTVAMGITFLPLAALEAANEYHKYKVARMKLNGNESETKYLKNQLEIEKEKLEELKKDKTTNNEMKNFKLKEVNDLKELNDLKEKVKLYYELGYNEKKYLQYYKKDKLEKILPDEYNEEDIKLAKEYFKSKVKTRK